MAAPSVRPGSARATGKMDAMPRLTRQKTPTRDLQVRKSERIEDSICSGRTWHEENSSREMSGLMTALSQQTNRPPSLTNVLVAACREGCPAPPEPHLCEASQQRKKCQNASRAVEMPCEITGADRVIVTANES